MKLSLAACNFEVSAEGGRIQLLPHGEFRAIDGRPFDVPAWYLTEENGFDVARLANASANQLVVDYEHQTLHKEANGQPAPAAGWMRWLEFTPKGLFADVEWTDKAAAMIRAREYRYISAVFVYDTAGFVRKVLHAALTNYPALDGMDEVLAAASAQFLTTKEEQNPMDKLLQQLFGLPDAGEDELKAALSALLAKKPKNVALGAVFDELQMRDAEIAVLSAQPAAMPDPAKYVPVETMAEVQKQLAALTAQVNTDKADSMIEAALTAGKLLPAQKDWAKSLAGQENGLASLAAYLDTVQPVAALGSTQTAQTGTHGTQIAALTAEEAAAAKMLGMSHAEFQQLKSEEKEAE